MKRINITVLIIIIFNITLLKAYDWPIKEDTTQHIITSVMGECRSKYQGSVIVDSIHHFHRGIDINAPCSTKVYAIEGDTCYKDIDADSIEEMEFIETALDFNLKYTIMLLII